ncbi:hypothetical protein [Burkholderia sp. Ac-20349]|uniref:hypothetical protein n=1 Tax=Burkholderia sp. Ac-20349 TaxID=2703893 RepID=UPI00197B5CE7|nr:hypothetical protein [Burkholderia sp. Ac-20349]MBN3842011.1 hypothetical protein [Burkholderia sp. Ac-20349]
MRHNHNEAPRKNDIPSKQEASKQGQVAAVDSGRRSKKVTGTSPCTCFAVWRHRKHRYRQQGIPNAYIAYFVHEETVGRQDLDQFRIAEAAVVECAVAGRKAGTFEIPASGRAAVEHILLMRDQQLASTPAHVVASAHVRLAQFIATEKLSPIADL